jgi:hypothetical protein
MIHVPLFLVESLPQYRRLLPLRLWGGQRTQEIHRQRRFARRYFLWYGIVRLIMEPMRDSAFNMGTDNAWSICNSIVYIVLGLGAILYFHLHDYLLQKEHSLLQSLTASTGSGTSVTFLKGYIGFDLLFSGQAPALLVAYIFSVVSLVNFLLALLYILIKKEKEHTYSLYGGMGFALLSALMFLLGKDWTSLPSVEGSTSIVYSLSYGFVLLSLGLLLSFLSALAEIVVGKEKEKREKIALENGESTTKESL